MTVGKLRQKTRRTIDEKLQAHKLKDPIERHCMGKSESEHCEKEIYGNGGKERRRYCGMGVCSLLSRGRVMLTG